MDVSRGDSNSGVNPKSVFAWDDKEALGWGKYSQGYSISKNHILEAYANYNEEWGIHKLDVMAGYSWQHVYNGGRSISYLNETNDPYLTAGETVDSRYRYGASESYLVSFYSRVNYSIASKYLFTASLRTDGSSKFSPATRWGVFPSGAFAWN